MTDLIKQLADQAQFSIGEIQAEVLCPDCDTHNENPELYKIIDEFMKFPTEVQLHIQDTLESKRKMFAELIVRECIEHIQELCYDNGEWYESDILKHFGIKQ